MVLFGGAAWTIIQQLFKPLTVSLRHTCRPGRSPQRHLASTSVGPSEVYEPLSIFRTWATAAVYDLALPPRCGQSVGPEADVHSLSSRRSDANQGVLGTIGSERDLFGRRPADAPASV